MIMTIWGAGHFLLIEEKVELKISSSFQNCKYSFSHKMENEDCSNQRDLFPI